MSILTQVSIPDAFIIFFLTLGPLKAIGPFAKVTRGADPALRRSLAWRATLTATLIVFAVALVGFVILKNWRVSVPAIIIAGSLILFRQAFQVIMEPPAAPAAPPSTDVQEAPPSLALAQFPLAIPVLVTAPGIAAILAFMGLAADDLTQKGVVIAVLLVIMALNLICLLNVGFIFQHVSTGVLLALGWVMAVLQATLAAQYIINTLVRLRVLTSLGS
jgi:multiple antibiotic resistance protein